MKIFRISNILILASTGLLGTLLFYTSQTVQETEDVLARERTAVSSEEESIRVLSAEWDYLNQPQRLEELAHDYLDMQPASSDQIMNGDANIPEPSAPVLPGIKPDFRLQHVSMEAAAPQAKSPPKPEPEPVIQKPERRSFDALLDDLNNGGVQ